MGAFLHGGRIGWLALMSATIAGAVNAQDTDDIVTKAKAIVEKGYQGSFEMPPTKGPKAVTGKNIWFISCGQAYVACVQEANGFAEAAKELGWTARIQDGRASPSVASDVIRQAVAAKVDGIAVAAFDCPGIKSALLLAKSQKIPVVAIQSIDCSDAAFGKEEPLFSATVNLLGSPDANSFYYRFGQMRAYYILAKTDGKADIVSINETSQRVEQKNSEGFASIIAQCKDCKLNATNFTYSQVPNPATQIWQSALLKNPKANVYEFGVDALMGLGLQTAVRQTGRTDVIVGGAEGFPQNFDLIRSGTQTFSVAMPFNWFGWATADTLNRVLAGEDPASLPSQGTGFQYIDREHGLPAPGEPFEPSIDYRGAYGKIWKG